jgi:hypothetical protein
LLDLVSRTILATPDLTAASSRVRELWLVSAGIANTCFVLLIVAGGVLVMSHETLQSSYSAKEIAPRLALAFLTANLSLFTAGQVIPLANALPRALLNTSADPDHVRDTLKTLALAPLDTSSGLLILLAVVIAVMAMGLVAAYVVRVSLLIALIVGAPLALACHALPTIEGLAHLWWRALAGCLGIQVGQALVLGMAVRVFFEADRARVLGVGGSGHLVDLIVVGCLPPLGAGLLLALGRFDGRSFDQLVLAAVRFLRAPRRYVPAPDGIPELPDLLRSRTRNVQVTGWARSRAHEASAVPPAQGRARRLRHSTSRMVGTTRAHSTRAVVAYCMHCM